VSGGDKVGCGRGSILHFRCSENYGTLRWTFVSVEWIRQNRWSSSCLRKFSKTHGNKDLDFTSGGLGPVIPSVRFEGPIWELGTKAFFLMRGGGGPKNPPKNCETEGKSFPGKFCVSTYRQGLPKKVSALSHRGPFSRGGGVWWGGGGGWGCCGARGGVGEGLLGWCWLSFIKKKIAPKRRFGSKDGSVQTPSPSYSEYARRPLLTSPCSWQ